MLFRTVLFRTALFTVCVIAIELYTEWHYSYPHYRRYYTLRDSERGSRGSQSSVCSNGVRRVCGHVCAKYVPIFAPLSPKAAKKPLHRMRAASPKRGTPRASSPKRSTPTKLPKPPLSRRSAKLDPSPRGAAADGERVKVIVRLRPAMSEVETANSFSHDERQVARPTTGPGRPCRVSTRYPTPNA